MKYLCLPSWKEAPKPATVPGWTELPLWNLGEMAVPNTRPRPEGRPVIVDWEYGLPKQAFAQWNALLRNKCFPGDIVYGFDCGVNSRLYDETVGMIAKKLMPYRVAMSYDLYVHASESKYDWDNRAEYRAGRLSAIGEMTGVRSVAFVSPIIQFAEATNDYPKSVEASLMRDALAWVKGHNLTPCIYAAATTVRARSIVDEAVTKMVGVWDEMNKA